MGFASKEESKLKMVALTDNGQDNIVWYSPIKQNGKPDNVIIAGMLRRFENRNEMRYTRCIQFYDTKTDELIAEYK